MSRQILKSCLAIALALAVLYSGVAWVMATCFRDHDHFDDSAIEVHHQSQQASFEHSHDTSVPVIHCASVSEQVGPAARVASAEIRPSGSGISLHAASPTDGLSVVLRNDLWLEALFKRIVTFSLPIDFARHLFLSVLRI